MFIYTSIYYCCKSFPVLLHDVMVGGWIASYVFIFIFWSRCCYCCCVLLLLPTTSVLKWREVPPTVSSFSVSATTAAVSFASILLLLLPVEKGYAFLFFGRGAADAANNFSCWLRYCCCWCLCCFPTSVLNRTEVPATASSFHVLSFTLRCFGRLLLLLFLASSN